MKLRHDVCHCLTDDCPFKEVCERWLLREKPGHIAYYNPNGKKWCSSFIPMVKSKNEIDMIRELYKIDVSEFYEEE